MCMFGTAQINEHALVCLCDDMSREHAGNAQYKPAKTLDVHCVRNIIVGGGESRQQSFARVCLYMYMQLPACVSVCLTHTHAHAYIHIFSNIMRIVARLISISGSYFINILTKFYNHFALVEDNLYV